jgi:glutamate formiminotransferase/formiminotetrahydrofolate cyclodeaminase
MIQMAKFGNISSASDLEVGAKSLETGIWGAYKNVKINLPQIRDSEFKNRVITEGEQILNRARVNLRKIEKILENRTNEKEA